MWLLPSGQCPSPPWADGQNGLKQLQAPAPCEPSTGVLTRARSLPPSPPAPPRAPLAAGTVNWSCPGPGTYWLACSVDGHCRLGMLLKVTCT